MHAADNGLNNQLRRFETELEKNFEIKTELLGPDANKHKQEIRILNRTIRWTAGGIE